MARARILLSMLAAAACSAPERPPDPFTASGEIIALGGGGAGAENACLSCHGLKGEGNGAGAPRLAGIGSGYMARQLEYFAEGLRQHPQMHAIAKRLSSDDRLAVSTYYDGLGIAPRATETPIGRNRLYHLGAPERGIPACAGCHGDAGQGAGSGNPPLSGQPAGYLAEQHFKWRRGERRGDPLAVMTRISQAMTPAEIRAVSAYAAGLPGDAPRLEREAASLPARHAYARNDDGAPRRRAGEQARRE